MNKTAITINYLILFTIAFFAGYLTSSYIVARNAPQTETDTILTSINAFREVFGESDLKRNFLLDQSARVKACDMVKYNYFAHKSLAGKTHGELIKDAGYAYAYAGEILGKYCRDMSCVRLWMNSPTHKAVILNPFYKEFGVARCGIYTVVHFGVRKNDASINLMEPTIIRKDQ